MTKEKSPSEQIDEIIRKHGGWKEKIWSKLRSLIRQADHRIIEEVKWKMPSNPAGLPVWSHNGIVCVAQTFKNDVKLMFFNGSKMKDPKKLFNARLKSKSPAIEFHEGDTVNESAFKALVKEAVGVNELKTHK
jgi:hypothetical protein